MLQEMLRPGKGSASWLQQQADGGARAVPFGLLASLRDHDITYHQVGVLGIPPINQGPSEYLLGLQRSGCFCERSHLCVQVWQAGPSDAPGRRFVEPTMCVLCQSGLAGCCGPRRIFVIFMVL